MISYPRRNRRVLKICLVCFLLVITIPTWAAEKMRLRVDDYQIDAELLPHVHKIAARAKLKFTALEDLNIATFELHNGLRVSRAQYPGLDNSSATADDDAKGFFHHTDFRLRGRP